MASCSYSSFSNLCPTSTGWQYSYSSYSTHHTQSVGQSTLPHSWDLSSEPLHCSPPPVACCSASCRNLCSPLHMWKPATPATPLTPQDCGNGSWRIIAAQAKRKPNCWYLTGQHIPIMMDIAPFLPCTIPAIMVHFPPRPRASFFAIARHSLQLQADKLAVFGYHLL